MTATQHATIGHDQATRLGYVTITSVGYKKHEDEMLERALADLHGTEYKLVSKGDGIHIYRRKTEVKFSGGMRGY